MKTFCIVGSILWLFLLLASIKSFAQAKKLRFEHITVDQGLPDNVALCSMQDSKGFLWFGTWNGLCKYDGYTFTTYQFDPDDTSSIGGNIITKIFEDHDGIIWVIAGTGIYLFDRTTEKFTRFNPKSGFLSPNNSHSWQLSEDKEGKIWTGNDQDGQLVRYDKQSGALDDYTSKIFAKQDSDTKKDGAINSIYRDRHGTLWIGSSRGLHRLNLIPQGRGKPSKVSFTSYQHDPKNPKSLAGNNIGQMYEDSTGLLWVNSNSIINLLDPESGECIKRFIPDPNDPHSMYSAALWGDMALDKEGNLWVGSDNILNKLNKEHTSFTRYIHDPNDPTSVNGNRIVRLLVDNSNILWVSTLGGLDKIDLNQKAVSLYKNNPSDVHSLSNNNVSAICEDKMGVVWLGTIGSGLNAWNKQTNTFTHYRHNPSKPGSIGSDSISAIIEDREGNLWIGGGKNSIGILSTLNQKTSAFKNRSFRLPFSNT